MANGPLGVTADERENDVIAITALERVDGIDADAAVRAWEAMVKEGALAVVRGDDADRRRTGSGGDELGDDGEDDQAFSSVDLGS